MLRRQLRHVLGSARRIAARTFTDETQLSTAKLETSCTIGLAKRQFRSTSTVTKEMSPFEAPLWKGDDEGKSAVVFCFTFPCSSAAIFFAALAFSPLGKLLGHSRADHIQINVVLSSGFGENLAARLF